MSQAKKAAVEQASLPQLLFRQCVANCVDDSTVFSAETDAEKMCLANCQAKTYQAFDMYWAIRQKMRVASVSQSVDVSRYTGMEIEHGHNTGGYHNNTTSNHLDMGAVNGFKDASDKLHGGLKAQAMGHTLSQ